MGGRRLTTDAALRRHFQSFGAGCAFEADARGLCTQQRHDEQQGHKAQTPQCQPHL